MTEKGDEFCGVSGAFAFSVSIWAGSLGEGAWIPMLKNGWDADQTDVWPAGGHTCVSGHAGGWYEAWDSGLVLSRAVAHGGRCQFLRPKVRPVWAQPGC